MQLPPSLHAVRSHPAIPSAGRFGRNTDQPAKPPDIRLLYHRPPGAGREYEITNRGQELLMSQAGYPSAWVNADGLKGLKIADLCCGGGRFVTELRAEGVDIVGVDDYLDESQLHLPEAFIRADIRKLPWPDESLDMLYSALGVFSFGSENRQVQTDALKEASRVLKPGGKLRLGDVQPGAIRQLLRELPGNRLALTGETPIEFRDWNEPLYAELTKQ